MWKYLYWDTWYIPRCLGLGGIIINEVKGFFLGDTIHMRHLVPELYTVKLTGMLQQLWPEENDDYLIMIKKISY